MIGTKRRWVFGLAAIPVALTLALPRAVAADVLVGSGDIESTVSFSVGVAPVLGCAQDSWSLSGGVSQASVVRDLQGANFVGGLTITASGHAAPNVVCSNASQEIGAITALGASGSSSITRTSMGCSGSGQYFRVGPAVLVVASAACQVSGLGGTGPFIAEGDLTPTSFNIGGPITQALFAGDYQILG